VYFPRSETCQNTHRITKASQQNRLAEIHHRQAVHQRTQKNVTKFASPGGTGLHRQAVHQGTQKHIQFGMRRLAAMYSPPGGFWKISRIHNFVDKNGNHAFT